MITIREFIEKINSEFLHHFHHLHCETDFSALIRYDEPMSAHTTFKVGGPAAAWIQPAASCFPAYAAALLQAASREAIPVFILGGGANIVVSDAGYSGIILDTGGWTGPFAPFTPEGESLPSPPPPAQATLSFRSGTPLDDAVEAAAERGLGGLEFLAGMPGTIGGALYMNARCFGKSVSDILAETAILDEKQDPVSVPFRAEDFGYKKSPFQNRNILILSAAFAVGARDKAAIRAEMEAHRQDRRGKGHYRFPSAGSVFKNNRGFGKPTGQIIDELGLCGLRRGGAMVAPFHGNIIINTGDAAATDIRALVDEVRERVKTALGIELESEVLFVGE